MRGVQEQGGLITRDGPRELAAARRGARSSTNYRGIDVYKLDVWTQGPAMLQSLNILENFDLRGHGLQQRAATSTRSTRR